MKISRFEGKKKEKEKNRVIIEKKEEKELFSKGLAKRNNKKRLNFYLMKNIFPHASSLEIY